MAELRRGVPDRRPVPGLPGEWMEFRELTGPEWDSAVDRATAAALKNVESSGVDPEWLGSFNRAQRDQVEAAAGGSAEVDRQSTDATTLCGYGIVAWSPGLEEMYGKCGPTAREALPRRLRDWAAGVIREINARPPASAPVSTKP